MMKKALLYLVVFPAWAFAQQPARENFAISGSVKGLEDKSLVFLTDANKPTDTLAWAKTDSGGAFRLTGHLAEPNLYEINFASARKKYLLFMGNDAIDLSGGIEDMKDIQVKGSPSHDDFLQFQQIFNPLMIRLNGLTQIINATSGTGKNDSLMNQYNAAIAAILTAEDQFVHSKNTSAVAPFVLTVLAQLADGNELAKKFKMLSPEAQSGFFGRYLKQQIEYAQIGEVGSSEIDFVQNDTTGKPVQLSSFKGKYVLVDFWASWCHPCRMENPNVVAAFNKFKNKNFTVLGVSLDKAKEPWVQAIKQDNLIWTQVSDLKFWNNDVAIKYHIQQIPQNMLIGPDGKIVAKNLRGEELQSKLCELLGCN